MDKKTNVWNHTAYQKTTNAGIAFGGLLTTGSIAAAVISYFYSNSYAGFGFTLFIAICSLAFILGLISLLYFINRQENANDFYKRLIVIWKYNPSYVYRYKKYTVLNEKGYTSKNFFWASVCFLILALITSLNTYLPEISTFFFVLFWFCIIMCLYQLPIIDTYLVLPIKQHLFGTADHVILSRAGVYAFGKLYKFGTNSFTFHKAYKKQVGAYDTIAFTYQRMRGYQVLIREIHIPIPPETSQEEINELLEMYNSSALYMSDTVV